MNPKKYPSIQGARYLLAAGIFVGLISPASAQNITSDPFIQSIVKDMEEIRIIKGEIAPIDVKVLQKVSVGDPEIADIVTAEGDQLLIIGKTDGNTPVFVWDANGKHTVMVYVVKESLDALQRRIEQLLIAAGIEGVKVKKNENERRVVVTGVVQEPKREQFDKIVEPLEDNGQVIVLVNQGRNEDLVQVDMQMTEVSSSQFRALGVDWFTGEITRADTTLGGQTVLQQTTTVNSGLPLAPDLVELVPFAAKGSDAFKVGDFFRSQALVARINAMVEEGNAKILSRPKLVVVSGEEASFLVGGEIPIRLESRDGTGVITSGVQFKQYGTGLTLTPTIKKDDKIDIILNVDISDIDRSNKVGNDVAYTLRTAQTRLLLDDGETVVLAGLIKNTNSEIRRRVPYVSKVPVVGMLFRSKKTPVADQDTELVLSLTPHIMRDAPKSPAPSTPRVEYQPIQNVVKPAPPAPKEEASPDMQSYLRSVQDMIAKSVVYPSEASELGWEGTVKINMMILSDGTLAFALVEESSGYDILDRSALNLVKNLAYPAFPSMIQQKDITVSIPIVYAQGR